SMGLTIASDSDNSPTTVADRRIGRDGSSAFRRPDSTESAADAIRWGAALLQGEACVHVALVAFFILWLPDSWCSLPFLASARHLPRRCFPRSRADSSRG